MRERELRLPSFNETSGFNFYYPRSDEIAGISRKISQIIKVDPLLAPQTENEVNNDITKGSYVLIGNGEKLIGFSKINFLVPKWVEENKSYVEPSYRGEGVHTLIKQEIILRNPGAKIVSITANPAVEHINRKLGFRKQNFYKLPPGVIVALVKEYAGSTEKIMFQFTNIFIGKGLWVRDSNL